MTICRIKQEERIKSVVTGTKVGNLIKGTDCETEEADELIQRDIELDAFDIIKEMLIRRFKGHGMAKVVDYGLLVSWSGFKSSVIKETARQFFKVRLWTHKEIVDEFLANYDRMDHDIKLEIPLKRIWVINNSEE